MRKTSIVVALCFVLIGTLIAIIGVTAAPTDDSAIQRFDIEIGNYKYGELTVDTLDRSIRRQRERRQTIGRQTGDSNCTK